MAHIGRQRVEHVLHLRGLLLQLLDQLVERLRRVVAEHIAVLLHELVEVRLLAAAALLEHFVEVLEHLAHAIHILVGHVLDHLREIVEEGVHHRLLQLLEQLVVTLFGLAVLEFVLAQAGDLARRVLRQVVDLLLFAFESLAQRLGEPLLFLVGQAAVLLLSLLLFGLPSGLLARLRLFLAGFGRLRARADFVQPIAERALLKIKDFIQLALDVLENRRQIEAIERVAALLAQLLQQIAQAVGTLAVGRAHAALQHAAQRLLEIAEVHQVVGQRLQYIVGVELGDVLRSIPLAVAEAVGHRRLSLLLRRRSFGTPAAQFRRGRRRRARSYPCSAAC